MDYTDIRGHLEDMISEIEELKDLATKTYSYELSEGDAIVLDTLRTRFDEINGRLYAVISLDSMLSDRYEQKIYQRKEREQ